MLELKTISKQYGNGEKIIALESLSLKISEGEFLAIIGPSGCGKSTLMHILGLLDTPDKGEYFVDNQRVDNLSSRQRAHLRNRYFGFVFQSFNLLSRTSVFENVALPLRYRANNFALQKVNEVLKAVDLYERRTSWPNQLSGGQQQRVAIARALAAEPKVILADEPTGNLDSKTGQEIMNIFKDIHSKGKTIVLVTHNQELINNANRVIEMKDGQIIRETVR